MSPSDVRVGDSFVRLVILLSCSHLGDNPLCMQCPKGPTSPSFLGPGGQGFLYENMELKLPAAP